MQLAVGGLFVSGRGDLDVGDIGGSPVNQGSDRVAFALQGRVVIFRLYIAGWNTIYQVYHKRHLLGHRDNCLEQTNV